MAILHIVLVTWKDDVQETDLEHLRHVARGLRSSIPGILGLEEGPSVSPEGLEAGYHWALAITFADEQARDEYLPHPEHVVLADLIGTHSERVAVFDLATSD